MYQLANNAPVEPAYADTSALTSPVGPVTVRFDGDPEGMNWMRPDQPYAAVVTPGGIGSSVTFEAAADGTYITRVTLTNETDKTIFTTIGDIGVTLPLEDRYYDPDREFSVERHCDVHLFCGGTASWVLALRMSGNAPHLGLVVTEGTLAAYSTSRDFAQYSNDRGCFVLHPEGMEFAPHASHTLAWTMFPCESREDFFARAAALNPRFVRTDWDRTTLLPGDTATLDVTPAFEAGHVSVNGLEIEPGTDGRYLYRFTATDEDALTADWMSDRMGEHVFTVRVWAAGDAGRDAEGDWKAEPTATVRTRVFVSAALDGLLARRAAYIVDRQQYHGSDPRLKGTYLAYDNEEGRQYYYAGSPETGLVNDYNAGRERVGMGVFLATYLRALREGRHQAPEGLAERIEASLKEYRAFVERELLDETTGEVFNDTGRDNEYKRAFNYNDPWVVTLFVELFRLDGDERDLENAVRIIDRYYTCGTWKACPIEMPILALVRELDKAGMTAESQRMTELFTRHARSLAELGTSYPRGEVNFEQSIVAPFAQIVLQAALLTGDAELRDAALAQVKVLDQFQGCQPDAHLNEVSIRHWDGFWFGKRKQYGDTLPHYWSGLTGNVFDLAAALVESDDVKAAAEYRRRAEASILANLQLFFPDGSASAAYVFPYSVNGQRTHFADPMANDQDWALYFLLRHEG